MANINEPERRLLGVDMEVDYLTENQSHPYAAPHGSIDEYRAAVYYESIWLRKETDPVCRANIARQLAEFAATLADLEAEEARKIREQSSSEAA